jgi:hypothetical protein
MKKHYFDVEEECWYKYDTFNDQKGDKIEDVIIAWIEHFTLYLK